MAYFRPFSYVISIKTARAARKKYLQYGGRPSMTSSHDVTASPLLILYNHAKYPASLQIPPDTWPSYLCGLLPSPEAANQNRPEAANQNRCQRVVNRQRRAARQLLYVVGYEITKAVLLGTKLCGKEVSFFPNR
jgi:hypothetical protein